VVESQERRSGTRAHDTPAHLHDSPERLIDSAILIPTGGQMDHTGESPLRDIEKKFRHPACGHRQYTNLKRLQLADLFRHLRHRRDTQGPNDAKYGQPSR